jgi:hypothetical protein
MEVLEPSPVAYRAELADIRLSTSHLSIYRLSNKSDWEIFLPTLGAKMGYVATMSPLKSQNGLVPWAIPHHRLFADPFWTACILI